MTFMTHLPSCRRTRTTAIALFAVAACRSDSLEPQGQTVESVVISPTSATVAVGADIELSAQVLDPAGAAIPDRPVHWASEDVSIATVSGDGRVTAHTVGTVQVAASAGGRSGLADVTVTITPVASVHVSPGNKALFVGQAWRFTAEARDAGGTTLPDRLINWSSNNESVATVSSNGTVTALAPGGAIITASSEGKSAPASVTASAVPVASVQVSPDTQVLYVGQTAQFRAQPLDAAGHPLPGRIVLWSTTPPGVATVTSAGVVTGQTTGRATIVANCEGRSDSAIVDVSARPPNAVVVTPAQVLIVEGATAQLTAQVLDDQGQVVPGASVSFSSSDAGVAAVSTTGLVTGISAGKVTITASSGGKAGSSDITILATPVASVTVKPTAAYLVAGRTITLSAEAVGPTGQVLKGRTVFWSSSAPAVAGVSPSGVVTGLVAGTAVIFASVDGVFGWADITVSTVPVATVSIVPQYADLTVAQTAQLSPVLRDAAGNVLTGRAIAWTSDHPTIASVTATGLVTGLAPGSAVISATSGGRVGTADISVAAGVTTVVVTPASVSVGLLGTTKLTAVVRDPTGAIDASATVTWSSSNPLVASVRSDGMVTGLLLGTTTISATSGGATGSASVTVKLGG